MRNLVILGALACLVACGSNVVDFPADTDQTSGVGAGLHVGRASGTGSVWSGSVGSSGVGGIRQTGSSTGSVWSGSVGSGMGGTSSGQGGAMTTSSVGSGDNTGETSVGSGDTTSSGETGSGDTSSGSGDTSGSGDSSGSGDTSSSSGGGEHCSCNDDCPTGEKCDDGKCICDGDPGDKCGWNKTLLCHHPCGNYDNEHEICVGDPSVPWHLKHGDTLGSCH